MEGDSTPGQIMVQPNIPPAFFCNNYQINGEVVIDAELVPVSGKEYTCLSDNRPIVQAVFSGVTSSGSKLCGVGLDMTDWDKEHYINVKAKMDGKTENSTERMVTITAIVRGDSGNVLCSQNLGSVKVSSSQLLFNFNFEC